jgi:plastocyanin
MRRLVAVLLAVAAPAALAAGCGGTGTSKPVATHEVLLPKSYRFEPSAVAIKAGTSVTWTNKDNFTHTVEVEGRPDHKLSPGESVTIRFANPGTYHYECTLHSHDMHGEVFVT